MSEESPDYPAHITSEEIDAHDQVLPGLTPATLLDAMERPEAFEEVARADLFVQLAHMRRLANSPEFSMGARLEYMKQLKQLGKVGDSAKGLTPFDNLPLIQINLPGSGASVQLGLASPNPPNDQDVVSIQRPRVAVLPE